MEWGATVETGVRAVHVSANHLTQKMKNHTCNAHRYANVLFLAQLLLFLPDALDSGSLFAFVGLFFCFD